MLFNIMVCLTVGRAISEIQAEMARTQKNKATECHLGLLKAKLAKYRAQMMEPTGKKGEKGEGFDVMKSGDARYDGIHL
jgi:ribosome-interacting GTPase 1